MKYMIIALIATIVGIPGSDGLFLSTGCAFVWGYCIIKLLETK